MTFIAWICNESRIALLSDYAHNPIYQEVPRKNKYFTDSDERLYIDLRRSKDHTGEFERVDRNDSDLTIATELKTAKKKMRLRVTGYYQGEYMYMLSNSSLITIIMIIIMNTDSSDKKRYALVEFSWPTCRAEKEIFLFDSFGFNGFKEFLLQDDKNLLIKFSTELKKLTKKDSKIMVITLTFSMEEYKK